MAKQPDNQTPKRRATGQDAGPDHWKTPDGDDRERLVCSDCGFIHYDNPKIVVGAVAVWENKVLMCRRAIEPRSGFWTLPAGYMELNETTEEGAAREAWEEANADIEIIDLLALYNIPRISQVQMFYRARLRSPDIAAGLESLDVALFDWQDLPRDQFAFPTTFWALDHYRSAEGQEHITVQSNPPGDMGNFPPGTSPSKGMLKG
jgi:ADP-ribose pyrophosphatase YjhB (NUDIX family)